MNQNIAFLILCGLFCINAFQFETSHLNEMNNAVAYSITGMLSNHKMFLLGGCNITLCGNKLQVYDVQQNMVIMDMPLGITQLYGMGQTYVSVNENIYFSYNGNLGKFNMMNTEFIYPYIGLEINVSESCLTYNSNSESLYVIGGINADSASQLVSIYNLKSSMWLNSTSLLNIGRYYSSCNSYSDRIFIFFGANDDSNGLPSMEELNVNISNSNWVVSSFNFNGIERSKHRSVVIGEDIFILGGIRADNGVPLNDVSKYNIPSKQFTLHYTYMLKVRDGLSVNYDGYRMYIFGGIGHNSKMEQIWEFSQYFNTPPSVSPTISSPLISSPTQASDNSPKFNPSKDITDLLILIMVLLALILCLLTIYCYLRGKKAGRGDINSEYISHDSDNSQIPTKMVLTNISSKSTVMDDDDDAKDIQQIIMTSEGTREGVVPGTGNFMNNNDMNNNDIPNINDDIKELQNTTKSPYIAGNRDDSTEDMYPETTNAGDGTTQGNGITQGMTTTGGNEMETENVGDV